MKRFNITNNKTDQKYSFVSESIESAYPNGLPIEWGKDYSVVEQDITNEIEQQRLELEASRNRKSMLKLLAQKEDLSVAELKQAVEMMLRESFK